MNKPRIVLLQNRVLTDRLFKPEQLARLEALGDVRLNPSSANPTPEEAAALAEGADVVVTSWNCPPLGAAILDRCPDLKLIAHAAGTVKPIVTPDVQARGIRVSSANEALARGVAETALGLTIVSLKRMWELARGTREGEWTERHGSVRELYDVTIGIVGAGLSGRHLIRLLQAFDVRILVCDPYRSAEEIAAMGAEKAELDRLLQESDVVSIHAPSVDATRHMFNGRTLGLMKDDAVLINTSRGTLIDEDALAAELRRSRLWACLDVTDPEPPAADHPFRSLPNVTLLPHIAGAVNNGLYRIGGYVAGELERFARGQPLRGEVALAELHRMA